MFLKCSILYGPPLIRAIFLTGSHVMRVRECFAFDEGNVSMRLTDSMGCPLHNEIDTFVYNDTEGTADATIARMFKFQDSNRVNFQCDVYICPGESKFPITF